MSATRKAVIPLILFTCLIVLSGCGWWTIQESLFEATLTPASGRPPFKAMVVIAETDSGDMLYTYQPLGQEAVESTEPTFAVVVNVYPWSCNISRIDEQGRVLETVVQATLENEVPVPHGLWTIPNNYQGLSLTLIDLRYLEHGCINGIATSYTGFEDPDYTQDGYSMENDGFTYHVEIEDVATGVFESVFYGADRTLMGNEYVSNPIFYWFVNYTGDEPIYQYRVWSPLGCHIDPSPDPDTEGGTIEKRIHIYVKEWGDIRHWAYTVYAQKNTCN